MVTQKATPKVTPKVTRSPFTVHSLARSSPSFYRHDVSNRYIGVTEVHNINRAVEGRQQLRRR